LFLVALNASTPKRLASDQLGQLLPTGPTPKEAEIHISLILQTMAVNLGEGPTKNVPDWGPQFQKVAHKSGVPRLLAAKPANPYFVRNPAGLDSCTISQILSVFG